VIICPLTKEECYEYVTGTSEDFSKECGFYNDSLEKCCISIIADEIRDIATTLERKFDDKA